MSFAQACLWDQLMRFSPHHCLYQEVQECDFEITDQDKIDYNQKLSDLLDPIYNFLLQQQEMFPETKFAVVFDIDDTSFYPQSVVSNAAVFDFYHKLKKTGFVVLFISARPIAHLDISREQLATAGYTDYSDLIHISKEEIDWIRQRGVPSLISKQIGAWKASKRAEAEAKNSIKILATLDDKQDNLIGDACGIPIWVPTNYADLIVYCDEFRQEHKEIFSECRSPLDVVFLDEGVNVV